MMIPSLEYEIITYDRLKLFCQRWEPAEKPRGIVPGSWTW